MMLISELNSVVQNKNMNNKILEEIDKLKMMCLLDMAIPEKTDLERYEKWVEELQGRKCKFDCPIFGYPKDWPEVNRRYAEYRTLRVIVEDLFYKKYAGNKKYQEYRKEVKRITAEIIAMTLFVQGEKSNLA